MMTYIFASSSELSPHESHLECSASWSIATELLCATRDEINRASDVGGNLADGSALGNRIAISFFVTSTAIMRLSYDLIVLHGGGNRSVRRKPPPNSYYCCVNEIPCDYTSLTQMTLHFCSRRGLP